ncbi:MAG: S8 family peptidase [Cytophagaceae bacterium]
MASFPHLKLPFKVDGSYNSKGGGNKKKNPLTEQNKADRFNHGQKLETSIQDLRQKWQTIKDQHIQDGIPLPNEKDIPIFMQIDDQAFSDIDSFRHWGVEVISEEENGFIIGASIDELESFQKNVAEFLAEKGRYKDKASQIWDIITDDNIRIQQILKGDLKQIWEQLSDSDFYVVELGISCFVPNTLKYPVPSDYETEEKYQAKIEEYEETERKILFERDTKQISREDAVKKYLDQYNGELIDIWDNVTDAVFFKIKINGRGLKDLVHTYQYLYRVSIPQPFLVGSEHSNISDEIRSEIIPPDDTAPSICVIDSGIMESHILLAPAINPLESKSYVTGDTSTADQVRSNGHGTKVAGAILYPTIIPKDGTYKLETKIQNARILDSQNRISEEEFAPALMEKIVNEFHPRARIFNLSVNENSSYQGTHMPELAASIDKLTHEKNLLFIVSSGNIRSQSNNNDLPGIKEHLDSGKNYPDFLFEDSSGVANPGVSYFAITVGSISKYNYEDEDYECIAGEDKISPFSRVGLGMWNCIKPDVVEFGGDLIRHKTTNQIKTHSDTSPELVNSTLYNAPAWGKDSVGTSFATPKVSYIASSLQKELPDHSALMYRALIIQSARLPSHCFNNPTLNDIRCFGYGVPDVNKAIDNFHQRITFLKEGSIGAKKADIYKINIPQELRGEGKNFKLLVEVTLTFTAKTRLTRKGSHSYLSSWLEWKSSNYNESFESFRNKTINYLDLDESLIEEGNFEEGDNPMQWRIRENVQWGVKGVSRNYNTAQKDWAIIEPHQFAENFNIAVIGHAGWDKNLTHTIPYALCVSFELIGGDINIYELISQAQIEIESEIEL